MVDKLTGEERKDPQVPVRQWRVGTISMGLTLLALGIVLLIGSFGGSLALSNILKLWPIILITLGLEMVLTNTWVTIKGIRFGFTYDGLSIFLVLLLVFVSSGLVALESTGMLDYAHTALRSSQRYIEAEKVLYTVDDSLESLVLDIEDATADIRSYDGDEIRVSVVYDGYFASREAGEEYVQEQYVSSQRQGDTIFVQVYPPAQGMQPNSHVEQKITVQIPAQLEVEYQQLNGAARFRLQDVKDWKIQHQGSRNLEVLFRDPVDTLVTVDLESAELKSNLVWDSELDDESPQAPEAEKVWGEGNYSVRISKIGGAVSVNIP